MIPVLFQQAFQAFQRGDAATAAPLLDTILKLAPGQADALALYGLLRLEQGEPGEAARLLTQATAARPRDGALLFNLGRARRAAGDAAGAVNAYREALALHPEEAALHYNLGNALADLGAVEAALASMQTAARLDPADHDAPWNAALLQLQLGRLDEGWAGYEHGWASGGRGERFGSEAPCWDGSQALAGRTVLAWAEQGYGDTLQFARYLPLLAARGARVLLQCQRTLADLLSGVEGVSQVFARGEPLPPHDFQCPLMSLPRAFATRLDTIPAPMRLPVDPARVAAFAQTLPAGPKRVGIVWSGSIVHQDDARRSWPLEALLPLLQAPPPGAAFVCLQKDLRPHDAGALARLPADFFRGESLGSFADTAALLASLDLVIGVDTAVLHLAAGQGLPAWLMLPPRPDWRWLLDRDDSPWYPSLRLFRQQTGEPKSALLERVAAALRAHFQA
ncbi:tetratricopeptide repeat protein [Uliginosibacterium paludis]|uniref:Tetratricopeptide repeat protein n=1 Tax=Uliginosibacterium paludis TaxID=1615952 RepID=A0ABV2CM69_9RHOO